MGEQASFPQLVKEAFSFLEDYGFEFTVAEERQYCVIYRGASLDIEFYWGKGELDVLLQVKIENEIFRPYISRSFELPAVVRYLVKHAFESYSPTGHVRSIEDANRNLRFMADLMKRHCASLLAGDLSVLEEITLKKRI